MHVTGQSDPGPDNGDWKEHVTCSHGGLVLSLTNRKKVTDLVCDASFHSRSSTDVVSIQGGDYLKGIFPQWQPTSVTATPCLECGSDADRNRDDTYVMRRQHEEEKVSHGRVAAQLPLIWPF